MKFNRRDLGYTIISRFELLFRNHISKKINCISEEYVKQIPPGILQKAEEKRNYSLRYENINELLDNTDFPDLTEISLYKNNFPSLFSKVDKNELISKMIILYSLRCKIAHNKGFFTSIDLDKLLELTSDILIDFEEYEEFKDFISKIENDPTQYIKAIPFDFNIDFLEKNGILNNIPIPDYEYEGGFVGREEDIKKIINYLNGEKFSVVTITGAGGVGKTSLALKVLQELTQKPDFNKFDAIIWLSAKENRLTHLGIEDIEPTIKSYEELLDTIIEVLKFDLAESVIKKEEIVNTIFELSKGILIVVDNLETISDERIINFIIDAPKSAKFLITSRKGLGQVERRHELIQLKEKEAIYLFRQTARDKQINSLANLNDQLISKYVNKVSCFPLAIKWVIGLVARGKEINRVIDSIDDASGDISKFCFEQIFSDLNDQCKLILYAISCFNEPPVAGLLQYVVGMEQNEFEDCIEGLILVSLIIPEQFKNEQDEIGVKYSVIPLTKGYIRQQLNKNIELKETIENVIAKTKDSVENAEKAKREYRFSINNLGAITDEEKVAAILVQTALQKYQANKYEDAIENYKSAISIAPRFSTIYRNWAVMESMEGHLTEADSLMGKAKDLSPKDPQIWLLWGNIHIKAKNYTEAHNKYQTAYKIAPEDNIILNAFAQAKNRLGEYEIADSLFRQSLKIGIELKSFKHEIINRTSLAENLLAWADFLLKDRNYTDAERKFFEAKNEIDILLKMNSFDPKSKALDAQFNFRLGIYYKRINNNLEALKYFQYLTKIKPLSNREDYYIVNGTIEFIYCNINIGNFDSSYFKLLNPLKNEFPYIFQKTANIFERYEAILETVRDLDKKSIRNGFIKGINKNGNFIIIQFDQKTVIADKSMIAHNITEITDELVGRAVVFKLFKKGHNSEIGDLNLL